jgi:two-component system, OmpR family, sensor histidine kinase KdpD
MPGNFDHPVLSKPSHWQSYATLIVGLALVSGIGLYYFSALGGAVITLLYLLCVLWAAYFLHFFHALLTAVIAVLLINFLFIEPRYTFGIASLQSWLMLSVFAALALMVSRAMQQLKQQRQQAQQAALQSRFFQSLAELLGMQSSVEGLLQAACQHVQDVFGWQVSVVQLSDANALTYLAGVPMATLEASSVQWALDYQRAIGTGTADWPELGACLLPFGIPQREVLVVASHAVPDLHFLRLLTHQCAQATMKLRQQIALAQAARDASEANFKKTLLTALSHDMRTPLTAILGAVNVLADHQIVLAPAQSAQLLHSIQAEASYLTQATENILTLVKLDAGSSSLHLDWESPQEVIQHVVQRYLQRTPAVLLQVTLPEADSQQEVLFKADAVLVAHALANLIDNALQWREAASAIEIAMYIESSSLVLSVLNQGPGFPPDFVISAFDTHTPAMAGVRGFGLGLSIVDTVMQLHGGQVQLGNSADQRTEVKLLFPFVYAADLIKADA